MIDAEIFKRANDLRHRKINVTYNPLTGEGCQGERERLEIRDAPFTIMYFPKAMMETRVCRLLARYGSVVEVFNRSEERCTKEKKEDFLIKLCELRFRYDFEYFALKCVVIRDKITARDLPFVLNRGQRRLLDCLEKMRTAGLPVRVMVLKARQWGCSTLIQIYMLWIQLIHKKNWNSVVCAHTRDASITIRTMYERAVKGMMPLYGVKNCMKPFQGTQNIKEVPERGCLITVGTAIEPDSVRSQDAKMAHFSEMAFYPNTEANKTISLETSIVGSIPAEPYTLIARESTANGVGDYFYEEWEKARKGETIYEAVFVEWYLIDIYRKQFDGSYYLHNGKKKAGSIEDFIMSMNEYEVNLFVNHKECVLENINWRRMKRSEMASEAMMKQEYPSDDIEAFQDSGQPAFRSEDVEAMRKYCKLPIATGALVSDCDPATAKIKGRDKKAILENIRFVADDEALEALNTPDENMREKAERNRLRIWEYPLDELKVANQYLVVFDPQKGISESADWGVICVINRYWMQYGGKPEVVAEWRGKVDKDIAIWIAVQIAAYYNNALLAVESNTYDSDIKEDDSEFIFDTVADYYNNLYCRTPADRIIEGIPAKYGFNTNRNTKPMLINNYVAVLREQSYIERNEGALNEARTYEQKRNGSFGAKNGKHDDMLMTRMIGLHICFNEMEMPKTVTGNEHYAKEKKSGESFI
jgi:hypothetical protein